MSVGYKYVCLWGYERVCGIVKMCFCGVVGVCVLVTGVCVGL